MDAQDKKTKQQENHVTVDRERCSEDRNILGPPVYTLLEEFENGIFSLDMHHMFSVHTRRETLHRQFGMLFCGNSSGKSLDYLEVIVLLFSKGSS